MMLACYELLPNRQKEKIEASLKKSLSLGNFFKALAFYSMATVSIILFLHFAHVIVAVVFILLFVLFFISLRVAAGFVSLEEGIGLALFKYFINFAIFMGLLYGLYFFSWLVPFEYLDVVAFPAEWLSSVGKGVAMIGPLVPEVIPPEFRQEFIQNTQIILEKWVRLSEIETSPSRFFMWQWVYFKGAKALAFLGLLLILAGWFSAIGFICYLTIGLFLFPWFQAAHLLKKAFRIKNDRVPLMGIIVTFAGGIISLFFG